MEIKTISKELNQSINDDVFCKLVDAGVPNDKAYDMANAPFTFDGVEDEDKSSDNQELIYDEEYVDTLLDNDR